MDGFESHQEVSPHGPGKAYLFYASSCGVGIRVAFTDSFRAREGDCCVFYDTVVFFMVPRGNCYDCLQAALGQGA